MDRRRDLSLTLAFHMKRTRLTTKSPACYTHTTYILCRAPAPLGRAPCAGLEVLLQFGDAFTDHPTVQACLSHLKVASTAINSAPGTKGTRERPVKSETACTHLRQAHDSIVIICLPPSHHHHPPQCPNSGPSATAEGTPCHFQPFV